MNFFDIFLGILTAAGGFIDISNLVFNMQSGALFGYNLLWATVFGAIGIAIYSEMAGRVAALAHRSTFDIIRERFGFSVALLVLVLGNIVNVLTCIAEIGGVAIVLRIFTGMDYFPLVAVAAVLLVLTVWIFKFEAIERIFGVMGLFMIVFIAASLALHLSLKQFGAGLIPSIPKLPKSTDYITYAYYVVGVISSILMPYEVYFYSSGGIEDRWGEKDLLLNKLTSYIGYAIGTIFALALTVLGAQLLFPAGISPQLLGEVFLGPIAAFGKIGLLLALLGVFFAIGGAAIETCFSGAYSLSQFFGWEWGRFQEQHNAPLFTLSWLAIFMLSFLILLTGVDPIKITQYAVIFSVIPLPFTYFPVLLIANDSSYVGAHTNGKIMNFLGWFYLIVIIALAIVAIPLFIASGGGNG